MKQHENLLFILIGLLLFMCHFWSSWIQALPAVFKMSAWFWDLCWPMDLCCQLASIMQSLLGRFCCCCSVAKLCLTLCDPMNCSTPGLPVLHYLSKFAQTHVHWVSDAIQASHPLSPPFSLALNLASQSIGALASILLITIQGWFPLGLTGLVSL